MIKEAKRLNQYLRHILHGLSMSIYKTKDFEFPSFETQTENQTLPQLNNNPYLSKPMPCLFLLASLVIFCLVFFFVLRCLKKLCNHQNTNRIDPLHIDVEMGHQHRVNITESFSAQYPTRILNFGPCGQSCQFGCRIPKMVGPKKQDFWPKINILKGNHCILGIRGVPVRQKLGIILESKVIQQLK